MRAVAEFVRPALLVAWKDVLLELRNREVVVTALVFGVMLVVIFNFALNITPSTVNVVAPGVLWVAFSFAGVLAMGRAFVSEREEGTLDALLLCPVSRDSIYFGKMLAMFLFMIAIEAALLPIFAVFFNFSAFSITLVGVIVLATLGFAAVGTLFAVVAANVRAREIMIPILFFPIVSPVIIGAVEVTGAAIGGPGSVVSTARWIQLLAVFDAVFLVICPWLFGMIVEE